MPQSLSTGMPRLSATRSMPKRCFLKNRVHQPHPCRFCYRPSGRQPHHNIKETMITRQPTFKEKTSTLRSWTAKKSQNFFRFGSKCGIIFGLAHHQFISLASPKIIGFNSHNREMFESTRPWELAQGIPQKAGHCRWIADSPSKNIKHYPYSFPHVFSGFPIGKKIRPNHQNSAALLASIAPITSSKSGISSSCRDMAVSAFELENPLDEECGYQWGYQWGYVTRVLDRYICIYIYIYIYM